MHKEYILLNGFRKAKRGFTAGFRVPLKVVSHYGPCSVNVSDGLPKKLDRWAELYPVFLGNFLICLTLPSPLPNNRGIDCSVRYHLVTSCVVQSRCCHCHIIVFPDKVSECHKKFLKKRYGSDYLECSM